MPTEIAYSLAAAFTHGTNIFSGNPAAVVFVPEGLELPDETLKGLAANFAQPITSFVTSPSQKTTAHPEISRFGIRWFTPLLHEATMCGHGMMAAAKVIFDTPGMVGDDVEEIEFETKMVGTVRARKVVDDTEGRLEISLAAGETVEILGEERERLCNIYKEALGREVRVNYIGAGQGSFKNYILVEIDEKDNLGGEVPDPDIIVSMNI
jgi:PhzF family phenazine biosynthesis protein